MGDGRIKYFIQKLKSEFNALQMKKVMKITSIKIGKENGRIVHNGAFDLGLISNIMQYEDLEYLVFQELNQKIE